MVREAMYRSEFEALKTKTRMHPLRKPGRTSMPDSWMATTKGDAEALLPFVLAKRSLSELYGTSIPSRKTDRQ